MRRRRMRTAFVVVLALVALLLLGLLGAARLGLLQGQRPSDLGVKLGRLKPPSPTPNSVSSQAALHPGHAMLEYARIDPLPLRGEARTSIAALRALVAAMPGATVVEQRDDYLYAEFATPVLRFVDDVEFWVDPAAGAIQVRSASRLGRKDFGVNRQRVEAIRARWVASP